jgi:hypothetical protein
VTKRALFTSLASAGLAAFGAYFLFWQLWPASVEYGWLEFGPTGELRALVSVTGCGPRDTITIQPFAGETPIGTAEQFENTGQPVEIRLTDPDGVTSYVIRKAATPLPRPKKGEPAELMVNVEIDGPVKYRQYSDLSEMTRSLETAPVSHFHGPLAIGPVADWGIVPSDLVLESGGREIDLRAFISTMDAKRGCWVVVKAHEDIDKCLFPDGVRPVADIEFPARTPGDPPIRRRYLLDDFC